MSAIAIVGSAIKQMGGGHREELLGACDLIALPKMFRSYKCAPVLRQGHLRLCLRGFSASPRPWRLYETVEWQRLVVEQAPAVCMFAAVPTRAVGLARRRPWHNSKIRNSRSPTQLCSLHDNDHGQLRRRPSQHQGL